MNTGMKKPNPEDPRINLAQRYQNLKPTIKQSNLDYLVKFMIAMLIFLCSMASKAQCSNAESIVRNHQDGILDVLLSSGDTNIYTEVLDCDYS